MKRLTGIPIAVSIRFQRAPSTVRQNHHLFTIARDANGFDQTLLADVEGRRYVDLLVDRHGL